MVSCAKNSDKKTVNYLLQSLLFVRELIMKQVKALSIVLFVTSILNITACGNNNDNKTASTSLAEVSAPTDGCKGWDGNEEDEPGELGITVDFKKGTSNNVALIHLQSLENNITIRSVVVNGGQCKLDHQTTALLMDHGIQMKEFEEFVIGTPNCSMVDIYAIKIKTNRDTYCYNPQTQMWD